MKLVIVGTGANAEHAFRFICDYKLYDVIGFAVDKQYLQTDTFLGKPVYSIEELEHTINKEEVLLFVALLWNRLNSDRKNLYLRLKKEGYHFANLISPKASLHSDDIGENCWIHDYSVIQNGAVIGNNVAMMTGSLVGSHAVVGNHCFLGAKSTVAGGCTVGEQTFVGINCTIFDDTNVGKKCILGACTAVKRNVPDFTLYKTSSDIQMKQYAEDEIESKLVFRKNVR